MLDKNIYYKSFISNKMVRKNDKLIIEFKTTNLENIEMFNGEIPFQFSRMSKYCDAFNELFNPPFLYRERLV